MKIARFKYNLEIVLNMAKRTFMDKFNEFRYTTFGRVALFGLMMSPAFIAQAYLHFTTPELDKNRRELSQIVREHRGHDCIAPNLFLHSQIDKYDDLEKEMYGLKDEVKDLLNKEAMSMEDFVKYSTKSLLDREVISEFASVDTQSTYILWLYQELHLGSIEGFEDEYVFLRTSEFPEETSADIRKLNDYKNGIRYLVDDIYKHDMDEFSPEALITIISYYQVMRNNDEEVTHSTDVVHHSIDVVQDLSKRFFNDYFPQMKWSDYIPSEEKSFEALDRLNAEMAKSQDKYTFQVE